jgi:hypothetical protein
MRKLFLKRSRELQIDDEPDSPTTETSSFDILREESHDDPMDQDSMLEPAEVLERSHEEPPIKRTLAWYKETLQEAKKHAAPSGTFGERKRLQRFASYVSLVILNLLCLMKLTSCRFGKMPCWMNTSPS